MSSQDTESAVCASVLGVLAARGRAFVANCLFFSSINQTDQMLVHLQSFDTVPEHFTIPESTKNGVPLFYIPPGSTTPVCSPSLCWTWDSCLPSLVLYSGFISCSSCVHLILLSQRVQVWCSERSMLYICPSGTSSYVLNVAATPLSPRASLLSVLWKLLL